MPKYPTVHEIAKAIGLSSATVSRALNDHPRISKETKKRVKQVAEAMGYTPNVLARSLIIARSKAVGIVVPTILGGKYITRLVMVISNLLAERGYSTYIHYSEEDIERERAALSTLQSRRVDGILLLPVEDVAGNVAELESCRSRGIPVVCIDRYPEGASVDVVRTDNRKGAWEAVKGLIRIGHRRIAYLHTSPPVTAHKERLQGYRDALEEAGLFREEFVPSCSNNRASLEAAISFLLDLPEPPTAFFCRNHTTMVTVFRILLDRGFHIPEDFSLVCFDRPDEALDILLPVSYVQQPAEKIAVHAVRLLLNRVENPQPSAEPKIVELAPKVIWRASCAPPNEGP